MVKLRTGHRMRKEIGIQKQIDMVRATQSEIKEDLRLMGLNDNRPRSNNSLKKRNFLVKKISSVEQENEAVEGLTKLIFSGEEIQEESVSRFQFQSSTPMISQRSESKDIDMVKSRNSFFSGEEIQEESVSRFQFQSSIPMISQRFENKDIDMVKSRNSSVHLRIGYSILAYLFMTQNFKT